MSKGTHHSPTQFYRHGSRFGRLVSPPVQPNPIVPPSFTGQKLLYRRDTGSYVWDHTRTYYIHVKRSFRIYKVIPVRFRGPLLEACLGE